MLNNTCFFLNQYVSICFILVIAADMGLILSGIDIGVSTYIC